MELKSDVRFNVTIDPGLLLSYELDKLTLENTSNGTFQKSEERPKCDENRNNENLLFGGNKPADLTLSKGHQISTSETYFTVKKLSTNVMNHEVLPNVSERRKYIKGNKQPSADEDINDLLHHLCISDSDNEYDDSSEENDSNEKNKDPSLRERHPERPKQLKNKRQAPYVTQTHHNPANLCLVDLYGDNSESNPFDILDYFSNTSEEAERNIAVSPEPSTNQSYDHITTSGDDNIHKQNKEVNSDYGITDSCLEECGTSSVSSPDDYETFFPLDFDNYVSDNNHKAFSNYMDGLLSQLPDCESTTCKFSDNGKTIPKCLKVTKNDGETKTAHILKDNKIRKNESSNLKSPDASNAKTLLASAPLKNTAKERLKAFLWDVKCRAVSEKILRNINEQRRFKRKEDVKVIYIEDEGNKNSEKRTNLHNAVLNSELEEIYCLVEMYVQYSNHSHTALNLRDKYDKTAIDYAVQNNMALVVEYLMEKNGQPYARIKS